MDENTKKIGIPFLSEDFEIVDLKNQNTFLSSEALPYFSIGICISIFSLENLGFMEEKSTILCLNRFRNH